jgi:hypothetical protein
LATEDTLPVYKIRRLSKYSDRYQVQKNGVTLRVVNYKQLSAFVSFGNVLYGDYSNDYDKIFRQLKDNGESDVIVRDGHFHIPPLRYKDCCSGAEYRNLKAADARAQQRACTEEAARQKIAGTLAAATSQQQPMSSSPATFTRTTVANTLFGMGNPTERNPSGTLGHITGFLMLLVFFPLLLLAHPRQSPIMQILSFAALSVECARYHMRKAFKNEWKVVLGVLTALGWLLFLTTVKS